MELTDEEIDAIAEPFVRWLGDTHGQRSRGLPLDLVLGFARAIESAVEAKSVHKESCPRCEGPDGPIEVEDGYTMALEEDDFFVARCGLCGRELNRSRSPF